MGQKKLIRFKEINSFPNVLQYPQNIQGQWKDFFKNNHPVILELACGKGEYAVGLAQMYPHKNFIGVDIKGNRLWVGAKKCLDHNITNTAFLRTQIDKINSYFNAGEVHEIWLTFPDPQLRKSKANKRLTHPKFLRFYQQILKPGGYIHLKTDSPDLYNFTKFVIQYHGLKIITDIENTSTVEDLPPELNIKTHYESLDISKSNRIYYLCFILPGKLADDDKVFSDSLKNEETNIDKQALNKQEDFYLNEQGNIVFTAKFLLNKGNCCGNGCKHCPYNYIKVAEPLRSKLLHKTKSHNR
jgi:tRNA (guanine-N7-)-methyltransferase